MPLAAFHPAVATWFERAFGAPTEPQHRAWPAIHRGEHTLIAAPTGSGKTLAAFLSAIDQLVREGAENGVLPDAARVLYVSPLKALSHDVEKNLSAPLLGIAQVLTERGEAACEIRTFVRTGDTAARARLLAVKRPPHVVVTTPESLYILLTSEGGRRMLSTVRSVIVDEIHALVRDKRGAHLALSLERLEALVQAHQPGARVQRIGLSATQKPIEEIAQFLVGARADACTIVDAGHRRALDLALELPGSPLEAVMSGEVWDEVYERLVSLIEAHKTTLVFVNTRRAAERVAKQLSDRLGAEHVGAHHGSLAREKRLQAEQKLKAGQYRALVATASLELGIDIGDVELTCQLGSPRAIATFLQRVGRSGHHLRGVPKGRLFPFSRDDLVECTALLDAVRRGELDRVCIPRAPLDVLAQQIVATVASEAWDADALFALMLRAHPYRELARCDFDAVVQMLADGFATRRGRRSALVHFDAVNQRLKGRRGARLLAITSGGAIPDSFDYEVRLEPEQVRVGSVHEDFAIESMAGDVFQLGNASYRIKRVDAGVVRVEDAKGQPPTLPFWIGEAPGRTPELSVAVSRLRDRIDQLLARQIVSEASPAAGRARAHLGEKTPMLEGDLESTVTALMPEYGLSARAARELVEYVAAARAMLGTLPTRERLVLERFFDETGSMHLVLHSPFGTRINRAYGLALRKRFCRSFNVELQAAANDDAIVLSLGPMHSFPLADVFGFVRSRTAGDVLVQALLAAPMFNVRWRWNASRALAIPRFSAGKKVPPRFQRMLADDLLACAFPDQVACAENLSGEREVPDHPLVRQSVYDCLHEAMDLDGLLALLERIERGEITCVARDLSEPSPLAQEVLNARPYAFLDDAPLEERRTQAVMQRRFLSPDDAQKLGALDQDAIARVVADAKLDVRDADELHDALLVHAAVPERDGEELTELFCELVQARRAAMLDVNGVRLWIAAERVALWRLLCPELQPTPALAAPPRVGACASTREEALCEVVRGRLEAVGPVTARELAAALGLALAEIEAALAVLESEGFVLRGQFRAHATELEWCERRLLARIHRTTLDRLRAEIEPVPPATYMRFLLEFQHVQQGAKMQGIEGLYAVVEQLQGFELAAASWERDVLACRVQDYDPSWLDTLSYTGRVAWARASVASGGRGATPIRTTPIALYPRELAALWRACEGEGEVTLSPDAQRVQQLLQRRGASFLPDIARETALVRAQVEAALCELVAFGLVSSDGFAGLRGLFAPKSSGRPLARGRSRELGMEAAGRYGLLEAPLPTRDLEALARALLARWGLVFRRVLEREPVRLPWGELLRVLRVMEARGEVRGGRFVSGFSGEQYALPEAVGQLRKLRREGPRGQLVSLCGADPLNLVGIITPGPRLAATAKNRVLLEDGVPVAVLSAGEARLLCEVPAERRWAFETALVTRKVRPEVRAYQGSAG
jgi:ATP-dependent Lhr-like helicase